MDTHLTQLIKSRPDAVPILKKGDVVQATLVAKLPRAAHFEIARVGSGVVYGRELLNARDIVKELSVGDSVSAKIVEPENSDGCVELSLTEADKQKSWQIVRELQEKEEAVTVTIVSSNSGGLVANLHDLKAFLPVSQLSNDHYPRGTDNSREKVTEELTALVGKEITVKVINVNPRTNKLIISEKEVMSQNVREIIQSYKVGDIIAGIISGLANFGAFLRFADNPEVEGLIHISELDHRLIESPKEVVAIGDLVQAKIVDIRDHKISLSLKALQPDPWKGIDAVFKPGTVAKGRIYKFNPFGAFVKLSDDIVGLIHVSEFGGTEAMRAALTVGESYDFFIESVKPDEKRIVLKLVPANA